MHENIVLAFEGVVYIFAGIGIVHTFYRIKDAIIKYYEKSVNEDGFKE